MLEVPRPYQGGIAPIPIVLEGREPLQPAISFADAIVETSSYPGRVFKGPDVIDLGRHQESLGELIHFTIYDPRHREAARIFEVLSNGKILVNVRPFIGNESSVNIDFRKHARNGSVAHSHPGDSIFSPADLESLLTPDSKFGATSSEALVTLVRKLILFRGEHTPFFSNPENSIGVHRKRILRILDKGVKDGVISRFQTGEEVEIAVFRELVKIFGFQVFEGGVRDRFLRRVPPDM